MKEKLLALMLLLGTQTALQTKSQENAVRKIPSTPSHIHEHEQYRNGSWVPVIRNRGQWVEVVQKNGELASIETPKQEIKRKHKME